MKPGELKRLDEWNSSRQRHAAACTKSLSKLSGVKLTQFGASTVYHLYVVRAADRDGRLVALNFTGFRASIHHPFAANELVAYKNLGYEAERFPVFGDWACRCLSLAIYTEQPEYAVMQAASGVSGFL